MRTIGILFVSMWMEPSAFAQALSESEAVRLALARPEVREWERAEVAVARAEVQAAGIWPNPAISVERASTSGDPAAATTEDTVTLSVPLDLSGRRGLRAEAAEIRVEARRLEVVSARADLGAAVRERFVECVFLDAEVRLREEWLGRVGALRDAVERRVARGDASRFDRLRLEREIDGARFRVETVRAGLERARAALAFAIGRPSTAPQPEAALGPGAAPPALAALLSGLSRRSDVRASEREREAAHTEGRAASRGWIPEVTLEGGLRTVAAAGDRATGYLVSISLPLPLFDHAQGESARAGAAARAASARRAIDAGRARADVAGLHARATRLHAAAIDLRARATTTGRELARMAEASYSAGESEIRDLVDAERGLLDAEVEALAMEHEARRARIALDRAVEAGVR